MLNMDYGHPEKDIQAKSNRRIAHESHESLSCRGHCRLANPRKVKPLDKVLTIFDPCQSCQSFLAEMEGSTHSSYHVVDRL